MPIAVACQCGAKFAAKDELAGKTVKCPKCSQPLVIAAAAPGVPTAAKWPGDPLIAKLFDEVGLTASKTGFRCPKCRSDVQQGAVLCVNCGTNLETGKQTVTKVH